AMWYASTCRECPAGCGVLAKNREGRVVKLEGNPLHPVNQGKLCARGHAALQRLYHPDRIQRPLLKRNGVRVPISDDEVIRIIRQHAGDAAAKGPERIALVTQVCGDDLLSLFDRFLRSHGAHGPHIFEPFAYEALKQAHAQLFDRPILPSYRLDQADVVVGFGADFLETWLSPVEYSRKFKSMHAFDNGQKGLFFHIGPLASMTAANADQWLMCKPGREAVAAMCLVRQLLTMGRGRALPDAFRQGLVRLAADYTPERSASQTDLPAEALEALARHLYRAKRPLVLPTATAANGTAAAAADLATVVLNAVLDPAFSLYDFDQRHRVEIAHTREQVGQVWRGTQNMEPTLLLLNQVNPLYSLPGGPDAVTAIAHDRTFVVVFGSAMDETAAAADLVVPVQHPLCAWGAYESKLAMKATRQPTMGRIDTTLSIGDLFVRLCASEARPTGDFRQYLIDRFTDQGLIRSERQWLRMIQSGGRFVADQPATQAAPRFDGQVLDALARLLLQSAPAPGKQQRVQITSSLRFYDGRHADQPWLPEIPDPVSQVAWQTVVMVHPDTLAAVGGTEGQPLQVTTAQGDIRLPACHHTGLHPDLLVIPAGQGHTHMGRYARQQGVNPVTLLKPGGSIPDYSAAVTQLAIAGARVRLARTSGSADPHDRKIALGMPLDETSNAAKPGKGLTMSDFPLTLPLPEGYDRSRDVYPPHGHDTYRWGMVVDLDRCIGCSACVAGCYAENNVGIVGEREIINGREMAWIRIERYIDRADPKRLIFLPMLCQHCDNAPCESVCPVYAPHHSKEGLNNQIYNRCIGTRFCAQNCPYKVRRFNWFDWQWPEPLNLQLNPDVTVRGKGVMEKCSFCVQRIKAAHNLAKNEQRQIRDGEVIPACAQTCPTDALLFGNLMDPDSAVRRKVADPRAYQVMGYLNTKPAVIYLKKVWQAV
ncbi:MAG: 4Fe-4S dicluster domain-containing protein, partial [Desulfatitalea sp.]|nr:4Fe-4S dicluster domain-containing protein [Desulfatitalea sp.]